MENLVSALAPLLITIPQLLIWLVGIAIAISRWRMHPKVSRLALMAFIIQIVFTLVSRFLSVWLPIFMRESGWSSFEIGYIFPAISLITTLGDSIAWILVLCAIFGWRNSSQGQLLVPPPPPSYTDLPSTGNTMTNITSG